jgi:uncharacterized protein
VASTPPQRREIAVFRFYAELNDLLPAQAVGRERRYRFAGRPAVKDAIAAQGVPHTEVALILVNGEAVDLRQPLRPGDRVAVYPAFASLDIAPLAVRAMPEPPLRFVCDAHLGKLARGLRLLGFDTAYGNNTDDAALVARAVSDQRVLLTRDRRLLRHRVLTHGYWVRATRPQEQVVEVLHRFQLECHAVPFSRCLACNGHIRSVPRAEVIGQLAPRTAQGYDAFFRCDTCGKVYWRGSHYRRMLARLEALRRR